MISTALDVPEIVTLVVEHPDPNGPFGAKGAGEINVIFPAAICNAIFDAVWGPADGAAGNAGTGAGGTDGTEGGKTMKMTLQNGCRRARGGSLAGVAGFDLAKAHTPIPINIGWLPRHDYVFYVASAQHLYEKHGWRRIT